MISIDLESQGAGTPEPVLQKKDSLEDQIKEEPPCEICESQKKCSIGTCDYRILWFGRTVCFEGCNRNFCSQHGQPASLTLMGMKEVPAGFISKEH